jgi:hypothetical protein
VSKYSVESNFPEGLSGPAQDQQVDERNLLAVASVHGRPQGDILQAFHIHFLSCNRGHRGHHFHGNLTRNVNLVNWAS